jgi:putative hydrolase
MASGDPFGELPGMGGIVPGMFTDVMRMMRSQDPTQFELISQLALSIALDPEEGNVDPADRISTEEITRIAELHVADVTGMNVVPSGQPIRVETMSRGNWVQRSLAHWRPLLGDMIMTQKGEPTSELTLNDPFDDADGAQLAKMMEGWMATLSPTLIAMQFGSVIGHLGRRATGQYDLLLPADFSDGIGTIVRNRREFATDWSLPERDVMLWFSVRDIALHAILSRDHVQRQLAGLIVEHAKSLRIDPMTLQQQLGSLASGTPSSMTDLSDLLGESGMTASRDGRATAELTTLVTVIHGYADWVTTTVAERAIGTRSAIGEAISRSRRERGESERSGDALIGVETNPDLYDRGRRFIEGVIERNGDHELAKLWVVERNIPTPAELQAPGLWLERINLPESAREEPSDN